MSVSDVRYSRVRRNLSDMAVNEILTAPLPGEPVYFARVPQITGSKPVPRRFNRQIEQHKNQDPDFNVNKHARKMSPAFRKWLDAA